MLGELKTIKYFLHMIKFDILNGFSILIIFVLCDAE